jgi:hypothetical protein
MQRLFVVAAFGLALVASPSARAGSPVKITITNGGTAQPAPTVPGPDVGGAQPNELDPATFGDDSDSGDPDSFFGGAATNRSIATRSHAGVPVNGNGRAKSNPELSLSFDGINFRTQRLANRGNQFSIEPPDQGLCAGNGYVIESVNDTLRILDTSGTTLLTVDVNTFYGYPAAIDRTTGAFGPEVTDPSCVFDPDTRRFFHVILTLDRVGTTSALAGTNHLDIAVSNSADPLGGWTIYRLPVQNDGTQGTPNHGCAGGPCLGDYPHIGTDASGLYLTTNEFSLFGSGFNGSQIYAVSKRALAAGAGTIDVFLFDSGDGTVPPDGFPGFTVWPAHSPDGSGNGGSEFFLSSDAVFSSTAASNRIRLWTLSGTGSLDSGGGALSLDTTYLPVATYGVPPKSGQKTGDFPLGQCLSDTVTNCWRAFLTAPAAAQHEERLDSNDSRMQQVTYANGKLWAALDTAVQVGGATQAGIEYFVLNPNSGHLFQNGYIAVAGNNVTYPAAAATSSGRGVIAFTLVGNDHYPTAAYASLDAKIGAGDIHVAVEGAGPEDGFSAYRPLSGTTRQRWGDYGAAAVDGNNIWIASEYIGQSCTLAQFLSSGFSCGGTRASFGNWDTRISKLNVQ